MGVFGLRDGGVGSKFERGGGGSNLVKKQCTRLPD